MSFLRLEDVHKTYDDGTEAVRGVDLDIDEGAFVVLLGPSGCGKTTTLRMIAGLERVTGGRVEMAGREVTGLRPSQRDVGFVFQFYALYPHLTVRENILFPLKSAGMARGERKDRLRAVVDRLGLQPLLPRHPAQLSGGDQQRVSLARAMVRRPQVYLMDEPLGTLDAHERLHMREFIRAQQQELGVTTIYVTHDQEEAMSLADQVVVMQNGVIHQTGSPLQVYDRPADTFVAHFVGSPGMNFIHGHARDGHLVADDVRLRLPTACADGPATLGVRPEYLHPEADGPLQGDVAAVEYGGSCRWVYVDTACGRLIMRGAHDADVAVGQRLGLNIASAHACLFAGDQQRLVS